MSFADSSSTLVRQRTSNSRMVCLSTRPSRRIPRTPACTASAMSLRYLGFFAMTVDLRQLVSADHAGDLARIEGKDHRTIILQVAFVLLADIRLFVLREPKGENRAGAR